MQSVCRRDKRKRLGKEATDRRKEREQLGVSEGITGEGQGGETEGEGVKQGVTKARRSESDKHGHTNMLSLSMPVSSTAIPRELMK